MPNSVTHLSHPYLSVRCLGVDLRDTCSKAIGLHAQNLVTVLGSIVNLISGDLCVHLRTRTFTLKMNKIFTQSPKSRKKMAMVLIWNC